MRTASSLVAVCACSELSSQRENAVRKLREVRGEKVSSLYARHEQKLSLLFACSGRSRNLKEVTEVQYEPAA